MEPSRQRSQLLCDLIPETIDHKAQRCCQKNGQQPCDKLFPPIHGIPSQYTRLFDILQENSEKHKMKWEKSPEEKCVPPGIL